MNVIETYSSYWERLNVSRETIERFCVFLGLLRERQKRDNLISRSSTDDIWIRHIIDSAQLLHYVPRGTKTGTDFGTGAGFPGIILSIMNPEIKFRLVEIRQKKIFFLQEVISHLSLNAEVFGERIEHIKPWKEKLITARALASLEKLFTLFYPFTTRETRLILPKGKKVEEELHAIKNKWHADIQKKESLTSSEGVILIIQNLAPQKS